MGNFILPAGAPSPSALLPPPLDPQVAREDKIANDTRVESELNHFIAAKQDALFAAPDAFYRTQGYDAIDAAPVATKNLEQLRDNLLDGLANDYQRKRLGDVLDAQMQLTREQMARHVSEQSLAWQRQTAQDRIALLTKEAAYHHNDTDLVDGLGRAAANAARAHARVGDTALAPETEDANAATARSSVLSAAIQARLDKEDTEGANALFTQVKDQLDPAHAAPLQARIETPPAPPPPQMQLLAMGPGTLEPKPDLPAATQDADAPAEGGSIDPEPPPDGPARPKTWEELNLGERLATVFRRFGLEGEARGATFGAASAGKRLQQVDELTKRKAAGEELNVTEERFLRKNRNAASELVGSVGRLVDAQKRIGDLPRSAALRRLLAAPTFSDALKIARTNPVEIATALGLESAPDATAGLAAMATLGPVGGGAVMTGVAGTQGYANGLIGALSKEGIDVTDPDQLKRALRDRDLMQRVHARAATQSAIEAGMTLMMVILGGRAGKFRSGAKSETATPELAAYSKAFAARPNKDVYQTFMEAPITGSWRSSHRRQANRYLEKQLAENPDFADFLNRELKTDVLAHLRSSYWRLNPPQMVWHHPVEKKLMGFVHLLQVEEHTNPELQLILHPGGRGGAREYFFPQVNPRRLARDR
jgi:hypothetical protein